ncbi:hypothetical protein H6G27_11995 [Nostoc linckia FACHB-104]|nr:hypothetical protein [Nostoc linckia FACHB-104]
MPSLSLQSRLGSGGIQGEGIPSNQIVVNMRSPSLKVNMPKMDTNN